MKRDVLSLAAALAKLRRAVFQVTPGHVGQKNLRDPPGEAFRHHLRPREVIEMHFNLSTKSVCAGSDDVLKPGTA